MTAREEKELARLKAEKARPKKRMYLWYLLLIMALIYIVDEIVTNSGNNLSTFLYYSFFHGEVAPGQDINLYGQARFSILEIISIALMVPSVFYKPLADRFGRRPFLFINTIGMALAMFVCFLANNFFIYAIGFVLMRWFVTPDEQVVYIFETAPQKWRGTCYSIVKGVAEFGLVTVPLLRKYVIHPETDEWKWIFFGLAIAAFVLAFVALFFARETDPYLDRRIAYLEMSDEEKASLAKKDKTSKSRGGLITGLVYALKNKQLRWIFICTALYTVARAVTGNYDVLMVNAQSLEFSTNAQLLLGVGAGILTISYGFLSDKAGRKITTIVMLSLCLAFFIVYIFGVQNAWEPALVGTFLGIFLAAYWGTGDTFIMMTGESSPTHLRASIMSAQTAFYGIGQGVSAGIMAAISAAGINSSSGFSYSWACFILAVPLFALCLILLMINVKETKGIDIEKAGEPASEE